MRPSPAGTAETDAGEPKERGLPAPAAHAAARAGLTDPVRTAVLGFGSAGPLSAETREVGGRGPLAAAWAERRHLIVRCGPTVGVEEAVDRLAAAGVSAETPALLASGLGTAHERLLYGSVDDVRVQAFGEETVLVIPHPAALPVDFPWPPTAAPSLVSPEDAR